jgi:glycosyltransferase involved in cell wall biosynthesis
VRRRPPWLPRSRHRLTRPFLSIITVVRDDRAGLLRTLASLREQSFRDFQHLILDGASTDGTAELALAAAGAGTVAISQPDNGFYDAASHGLALAEGEAIGFLNAGDVYAGPGSLSLIAETFADPGVDACYGDIEMLRPSRSVQRHWRAGPYRRARVKWGWLPPHPTLFLRRRIYGAHGGFDRSARIAADTAFMVRLFWSGGIVPVYVPTVLVHMATGGMSNGTLGAIVSANREHRRACIEAGLPFPTVATIFKMARKLGQLRL